MVLLPVVMEVVEVTVLDVVIVIDRVVVWVRVTVGMTVTVVCVSIVEERVVDIVTVWVSVVAGGVAVRVLDSVTVLVAVRLVVAVSATVGGRRTKVATEKPAATTIAATITSSMTRYLETPRRRTLADSCCTLIWLAASPSGQWIIDGQPLPASGSSRDCGKKTAIL